MHGRVTLCDLKGRSMKSLFGYYGDEPVTIHLADYIEEAARPEES